MAKKISKKRKEAFESVVFRANTRASSSYLRQFFLLPPFAKYSGAIMKIFINTRNNNGTEARERRGCCIAGVICLIYGIARSKVRDARQLALRGGPRSRTTFFSSISRPFRLLFNANSEELCRPCSLYNGEDLYAILLRHRESLSLSLSLFLPLSQISVKLNSK